MSLDFRFLIRPSRRLPRSVKIMFRKIRLVTAVVYGTCVIVTFFTKSSFIPASVLTTCGTMVFAAVFRDRVIDGEALEKG